MTHYHAVMIDETGCEFGVSFEAPDRESAYAYLSENYPESRCDQLEDPDDRAERERLMYERIEAESRGEFYWPEDEY